jgi:hypothetical protein
MEDDVEDNMEDNMEDNVDDNVEDNMEDNMENKMWRLPDRSDRRAVKLYSTVFSLTIKFKAFSILLKGLSLEMDFAF